MYKEINVSRVLVKLLNKFLRIQPINPTVLGGGSFGFLPGSLVEKEVFKETPLNFGRVEEREDDQRFIVNIL